MNPTMLNRGAQVVAENPQLQIDAGTGLGLVVLVCLALLVVAAALYFSGYQIGDS